MRDGLNSEPLIALRRIWAAAMLVLAAVTWRLWLPENFSPSEFPRVPIVDFGGASRPLDAAALCVLIVTLAAAAAARRLPRAVFVISAASWVVLFVSNQHRLQPWAYQAALYAAVFATLSPLGVRRALTTLTASIYVYSALGKFDLQFLHTVGPDFVATLFPWRFVEDGRPAVRPEIVLLLPISELAVAGLIALPKTRRFGGVAAAAMHLTLIYVLGPFGLGHSLGVVLWNVFLTIQAYYLFIVPPSPSEQAAGDDVSQQPRSIPPPAVRRIGIAIVAAAVILPIFERRGWWDHWLSWSLYSPHTSRAEIQVHRSASERLPDSAKPFLRPSREAAGWHELALGRWSLSELGVPVYPQARFQLGVAAALAEQTASPDAFRIKLRGVADRRTGQREETWLWGARQINEAAREFWLLPAD